MYNQEQLRHISKQFQIYGELRHAELCKIGHINETYTATYDQGGTKVRYVHQKINQGVFRKPGQVMRNFVRVTRHIRQKLEQEGADQITRRVITLVPTLDDKSTYRDKNGDYWRSFVFVEGVQTYEAVETPRQAYQAAHAFGLFQQQLVDLPSPRLHETIPNFHNSRLRFQALTKAVEADDFGRAASARKEIEFALKQEKIVDVFLNAMKKGKIPERITHNDTKFNNVMLDNETGEAMCVVDLDTVMPGCALYDFGDMVRTTTSSTLEDELDLSKVQMRLPMFKQLARGYIDATSSFLTKAERSLIAFSGKLITYTIGIRFLTDYLSGDTYFRVHRPRHNLDRARTQFKLVESIERKEETMQKFVDSL
tara:strand:+ start:2206 stop:3309 length:1104 start_codon:yes stop_codon:yes gene_type:complete